MGICFLETPKDSWNLSIFLPQPNSEDTHICFPKKDSIQQITAPRQKTQKSQGHGPWLERQQREYSCLVSDVHLQLPHLKAEAMFSTKANSVSETLRSALEPQPAPPHVTFAGCLHYLARCNLKKAHGWMMTAKVQWSPGIIVWELGKETGEN